MSDSEYQPDGNLTHEGATKHIHRYKKNTMYGRRSRSRRARSKRARSKISTGLSTYESNLSITRSYSRSRSNSPLRSETRIENRTTIENQTTIENRTTVKISESLARASQHIISPKTAQIFQLNFLQEQLTNAHLCPNSHFIFIVDVKPSQGLYHENGLQCSVCQKISPFKNFETKSVHGIQESNQRLYVANALTGLGYENLSLIMAALCLKIPHKSNFSRQTLKMYDSLNAFVQKYFKSVSEKIRSSQNISMDDEKNVVDIAISTDGTWKKRGHISHYGIVFIIEMNTGLALDFEVLSSRCEKCEKNRRTRSKMDYRAWFQKHKKVCERNWNGTAKGMETEGVKRLFKRSLRKGSICVLFFETSIFFEGLRYKWMICDGDSSAYEAVKDIYVQLDKEHKQQGNVASASGDEEQGGSDDDVIGDEEQDGTDVDVIGHEEQGVSDDAVSGDGERGDSDDDVSDGEEQGGSDDDVSGNEERGGSDDDVSGDEERGGSDDGKHSSYGNDSEKNYGKNQNKIRRPRCDNEDYTVIKEDCINHVQKRVSSQLKTIRSKYSRMQSTQISINTTQETSSRKSTRRRILLADGKPYCGSAGRMTKQIEQKFSSLYGNAIREASNLVKEMGLNEDEGVKILQNKCYAVFYHYIKQTDQEKQHHYCSKGPNSWCTYQAGKHNSVRKSQTVGKKHYLDPVFLDILQGMINSLTNKDLLRRCLRGATQNSNECLNSIVWSILSKNKNHGYRSIRGAAALACLYFNEGRCGILEFFKYLDIDINDEVMRNILGKDNARLEKTTIAVQKQDQILNRKKQIRLTSAEAEADATEYGSGRH